MEGVRYCNLARFRLDKKHDVVVVTKYWRHDFSRIAAETMLFWSTDIGNGIVGREMVSF